MTNTANSWSPRYQDPFLRLPGTFPLRDFLGDSGFASQSGQHIRGLMGVVFVLLRPVLSNVSSMVKEVECVILFPAVLAPGFSTLVLEISTSFVFCRKLGRCVENVVWPSVSRNT